MACIVKTVSSSIGKKILMALTGLFFCCFLTVHLLGNLTVYGGPDVFNGYVDRLHSLGALIRAAEVAMLVFALVHVVTGLTLALENFRARPEKYQMNKNGGGRTIGSSTMPFTGLILLIFIIAHLKGFHFADHGTRSVYDIMVLAFGDRIVVFFYAFAMIVAGVHVYHGFWSAFQTLGLSHEKYTPGIKAASLLFSLMVAGGFGFIPLWISFF